MMRIMYVKDIDDDGLEAGSAEYSGILIGNVDGTYEKCA